MGVIVPAGGVGGRAGFALPKQFTLVGGVPLLLRSLRPFTARGDVKLTVVPLPDEFAADPPQFLRDLLGERLVAVAGGNSRAESVRRGFEAIRAECDVVLVHDAARPFVSQEVVDEILVRVRRGISCVAAVPMSDTVKMVGADGITVERTVERDCLWRAQTPQGFPAETLAACYDSVSASELAGLTDEATLVERCGGTVQVVRDDPGNVKLTTARDFEMAEAMLQ
ncbi:MAG: 2-C-methyl-D-erythritol 4-phosphate cytidylyltransferase [Gemmatimonadales bacterium]